MARKERDDLADAVNRVDTVPPPASGDVYSAQTAVREVPPDVLDAIRRARTSGNSGERPLIPPAPRLPRLAGDDDVDDQAGTVLRTVLNSPRGGESPPMTGVISSRPVAEPPELSSGDRRWRSSIPLLMIAVAATIVIVAAIELAGMWLR
jgi:hypothetical protein